MALNSIEQEIRTVDLMIRDGESLITAAEAKEPLDTLDNTSYNTEEFNLVAGKYRDALKLFGDVLDSEPDNEKAIEGFAYAFCKLSMYYRYGGVVGMALLLTLTQSHYIAGHMDLLENSPRLKSDLKKPYAKEPYVLQSQEDT